MWASKDLSTLKDQLVQFSRRCYDRNLIVATGGNISCRVPGDDDNILIKGSGSSFCDMTAEDIATIDLDGNHIDGKVKKSKEWKFHAGIYKVREDVNVVIHVHPPYATAIAANHDELPLGTNHAKAYLKKVPTIDIAPSGSEKLAMNVVKQFRDPERMAILMKEHGITTVGETFSQAFYLADMLEDTAKIALFSNLYAKQFAV